MLDVLQNARTVIGLSGGSLPKFFAGAVKKMLQNDEHSKSWQRVKFIFCDERLVAYDNADSTFGVFDNLLLKDPEVREWSQSYNSHNNDTTFISMMNAKLCTQMFGPCHHLS